MGKSRINFSMFVTEYADQSDDGLIETEIVIPEDLSAVTDEDLSNLHAAAVAGFNSLYGTDGSGLTEDGLSALSVLTEGIERVQGEVDKREAASAERAAAASALASKIGVAPAAPVVVDEPEPVIESEPEAFADKSIRINLGALSNRQAPPAPAPVQAETRTMRDIVLAAPDLNGFAAGQGMDWAEIGKALDRRLASFNRTQFEQANAAGRHLRTQLGAFTIKKPFEDGLVMKSSDPIHVDQILQAASKESRLSGGSLVAAGGWCAPSETIYDLMEIESRDGLFSLPEIGVTRGGIKFTAGPDFATIYSGSGFGPYTEAEDEGGLYVEGTPNTAGSKPCYVVDCPDFTEKRLDFLGVCINAGLLMQRGYPEIIARTVRGALVAHDFKVSAYVLAQVVAGSTAVTMTPAQVGTVAPILEAVEIQAEHLRQTQRIARGATLEAVFPFWVRGAIRADLSRRNGVDLLSVSDAQIDAWFRIRGVVAQFVYGLDDFAGNAASTITWPSTARFLLYPAGTFVKGGSDIISLDTIYDSVNLGTNDFTALFSEEGALVAKVGHDSRVITVPVCSSGETGGGLDLNCNGTANVTTADDITDPVPGTVVGSSIAATSFTATVTGASDAVGLDPEPYRLSTDGGATWTQWQTSAVFAVTGLTTGTPYLVRAEVRDSSGNVKQTPQVTITTT